MTRRPLHVLLLLLVTLAATACYESSTPLSAPGQALDNRLLGVWHCVPNDPDAKDSATLRIGAFDGHQYFAEWLDEDRPTHYRAYPTRVGSTTLLNVQELKETVSRGRWMFLRYELGPNDRLSFSIAQETLVSGANESARLDAVRRGASGSSVFGKATALCTRAAMR